jgi:hypothetical protein
VQRNPHPKRGKKYTVDVKILGLGEGSHYLITKNESQFSAHGIDEIKRNLFKE